MLPRQRVIMTLRHEEPDRVPIDTVMGFKFDVWKKLEEYFGVRDRELILEEMGSDFRSFSVEPSDGYKKTAVPAPLPMLDGMGSGKDNLVRVLPGGIFEDEWGIRKTIGATEMYWHYLHHPLGETKDISRYEFPDVEARERYANVTEGVKKFGHEYMTITGVRNFFKHAWELRGFDRFLMDLCDNEKYVDMLLDRIYAYKIREVAKLVETGVDIILLIGDIGMQTNLIISPPMWRRYFKPRLRALIEETRKNRHVYFMFHSDGYLEDIIPDLIEVGFDILNPIQPECMNPAIIKERYGHVLTLHGTISMQKTLPFGTVTEVQDEVRQRIRDCAKGGGLVIAPANTVTSDISVRNLLAVYETVKEPAL